MTSVLQDWVMDLPLRAQGTILTAIRGCDEAPKLWTYGLDESARARYGENRYVGVPVDTTERRLTAYIRWCVLNPADPREVDIPGAFFQSQPPNPFKPSAFGHYPQHWYSHVMHTLEVIGYCHPDERIQNEAFDLYYRMAHNLHLNIESRAEMIARLTIDRIASGEVVS